MELSEIISYFATNWTLAVANVQYETYKIKSLKTFDLRLLTFVEGSGEKSNFLIDFESIIDAQNSFL